ncbi:MAG TPA: hypothetical protein VFH51_04575, partial [Myxococcota bacterium]|nr:hypothetical protein [Myxococcota bacterium]
NGDSGSDGAPPAPPPPPAKPKDESEPGAGGNPKVEGSSAKAGERAYTVDKVASRKPGYTSYNVTINGTSGKQTIPVEMSDKDPNKTAKIEDVARALAQAPELALAATKTVHVEPLGSGPYGVAGLAHSDGKVQIFGLEKDPKQLRDTILHETGHEVGFAAKDGRITGMKDLEERWKQAEAKDGNFCSDYAKTNGTEDFADTWRLYNKVKGTPQEAEERKKYAARFEIIDQLMKKGIEPKK